MLAKKKKREEKRLNSNLLYSAKNPSRSTNNKVFPLFFSSPLYYFLLSDCLHKYPKMMINVQDLASFISTTAQTTNICCIKEYVCVYPTPSPQREHETRSNFKQSKAGLNSKFSFSLIGG